MNVHRSQSEMTVEVCHDIKCENLSGGSLFSETEVKRQRDDALSTEPNSGPSQG